ncbi:MAG: tetratricopeptide repeat protein [Verrucomicrobia bacterium]|nr:tetratricopeptide repeat protein [Verrucomicrobiota bacterium]
MINLRFPSIAIGILVATGVLLYGYTLPFPFIFDDHVYLVDNPLVKDAHSFVYNGDFVAFSTYSRRLGLDPDLSTNFILRPVTYLTFYINYVIDGMKPRGFRAVNIAIHCANAALLFMILLHLLRASRKSGSLTAVSEGFISFTAALFFLVHPLQTESVTYVVQRFTSLAVLFYLFVILTYFISFSTANKITARFFRWTSVVGMIIGMLSKEDLFTAPFMLVALDWLVMGIPLKIVWRRTLPYFFCLPIIPALIVVTSWAQHSGDASLAAAVNITNPYPDPGYPYHYALTQLSAVLTYLRLILVPYGQNLDWEYPVSKSLWDAQVLPSVAAIGLIVGGAWWWYYRRQEDARRSLAFCSVIWYFVTIAISSSFIPLPDLMVEHRCYIASIGAFTALACCIDMARTYFADRQGLSGAVTACAAVWILALIGATVARNEVWRSEISNWKDAISKSPGKFRPLMNLGVAYVEHGKSREGVACFRKALQIEPALISGYENLATVENTLGNFGEALIVTQVGLKCAPQSVKLHFNQAVAYNGLGQTHKSVEWFKKSIELSPTHKQSHLALGMLYANLKQYDRALKHYKIAATLPTFRQFDAQLRYNIAQIERMVRQHAGPPMAMSGQ